MSDKTPISDKREHILLVAEELFGDNGFDGTSVRDIAQAAGVNLAMISYYFGSKEKLLEYLIEYRVAGAYDLLVDLNKDEAMSPWEKIDRLIDFYVDRFINYHRLHSIMYQQTVSSRSTEIKNLILGIKLRNLELIKKIIVDGQQRKIFRTVDADMTVGTMMGTIHNYAQGREYGCKILNIDVTDEKLFRATLAPRLKAHLKHLLRAHLDIKNEVQND